MASRRSSHTAKREPKRDSRRQHAQRPQRTTVLLRWCIIGVAVLMGVLYYQPLSSYFETRSALNERATEVDALRVERARLAKRLEASNTVAALAREARQLNLVRPGERLFIVKGVKEWRRANARKEKATLGGDG